MYKGGLLISLQSLNHRPLVTGNAYRKRGQCRTRPNSKSLQLSSVLLTDEGGNSLEPKKIWVSGNSLKRCQSSANQPSQPNIVGVIGGASVLSTLIFLEKLAFWSSKDGKECLPFVVCSDPALNKELSCLSPLRSVCSRNAQNQLNPASVIENLRRKRNFLQQCGARCLVIPCNLSNAWHREVSGDCSLPFLHVGECVAMELKKARLKPIEAASTVRIGVLTMDIILVASYYKEKLQSQLLLLLISNPYPTLSRGFEVVLLDTETMERTLVPAIEALNRRDIEMARNLLRIAVHVLLLRAVNVVVLASDDFLGLLPNNDPLLKKCIDPMDALARSTIRWAESMHKVHEKI